MNKHQLKTLEKAARMLRMVAHPVRIEIIQLLVKEKKLSVMEIWTKLGITQSMTSQHLAALKNIGVLGFEKKGNIRFYYILNKNILKLLACLERCAEHK